MTANSATQPSPEDTRSSCPPVLWSSAYRVSTAVAELSCLSYRSNSRIYKIVAGVKQKLSFVWLLFADTAFAADEVQGLIIGLGVVSF